MNHHEGENTAEVKLPTTNGKATISLVLGIALLGLMFPMFFLALPLGIVTFILAILALKEIKERHQAGRGSAITGLVLSSVAIIISTLFWIQVTMAG